MKSPAALINRKACSGNRADGVATAVFAPCPFPQRGDDTSSDGSLAERIMTRVIHPLSVIPLLALCGGMTGWAETVPTPERAARWAERLFPAKAASVQFHDTYWNPDGSPHADLFVCRSVGGAEGLVLTVGLSPAGVPDHVRFFYFAEPFDRPFRAAAFGAESRVIVTSEGLLLKTAARTMRLPPTGPDAPSAPMDLEVLASRGAAPPRSLLATNETVIPGVPNYVWYLNCALTAESMVLGYWNDHGCPGLVPGMNSSQGCYYAITEELGWLRFDRLRGYGRASEWGYAWLFNQTQLPDLQWSTYVTAVNTAAGPFLVSWSGAPYGAHSTVGIGYREADGQRFLVLHDTWVASPAYVNYDTYRTSIVSITATTLDPSTATNSAPSTHPVPALAQGTEFSRHYPTLQPSLSYAAYSYHVFEGGDFNADGRPDWLIGNFRNNVSASYRLALYTNNGIDRLARDTSFAPALDWYEGVHVARACDFDGDGDIDAAVTGYWMPVRVYVNTGAGLTSTSINLGSEYNNFGYQDLAWGDLEGDDDQDLVACVASPLDSAGKIRIFVWTNGAFQAAGGVGVASHWYNTVRIADLDNDGLPEIIGADRRGSVAAFHNNGGAFVNTPCFLPAVGHGAMALDVADIDGNGFADIVTLHDGRIAIFRNGATGVAAAAEYLDTPLPTFAADLKLADLNGDGFPELLAANFNTPSAVFLNRSGVFDGRPIWQSSAVETGVRVHVYPAGYPGNPSGPMVGFAKARGKIPEFLRVINRPVFCGVRADSGCPHLSLENLQPGMRYTIERTAQLDGGWTGVWEFDNGGSATNWTDTDAGPDALHVYRACRREQP